MHPVIIFLSKIIAQTFKPGLHIVAWVAEHACDDVSNRILKPSAYRLQIFLARDQYLRSLLPHGDQAIVGQLEKHVLKPKQSEQVTTDHKNDHITEQNPNAVESMLSLNKDRIMFMQVIHMNFQLCC